MLSLSGAIAKFVIVDRVLEVLTRSVDALMIYFILADREYGVFKAFFYAGVVNYAFCVATVWINNVLANYGYDMTGINDIRNLKLDSDSQSSIGRYFSTAKDWTLSRRSTIFWIGSWFWLDPDYVTILLQEKDSSFLRTVLTITLPSVVVAMLVWTVFYAVTLNVFFV